MPEKDVHVSNIDEVSDVAHAQDRPRKLSDYKPTNSPLSADEIDHEKAEWTPRTTERIGDMKPLPEKPAKP